MATSICTEYDRIVNTLQLYIEGSKQGKSALTKTGAGRGQSMRIWIRLRPFPP